MKYAAIFDILSWQNEIKKKKKRRKIYSSHKKLIKYASFNDSQMENAYVLLSLQRRNVENIILFLSSSSTKRFRLWFADRRLTPYPMPLTSSFIVHMNICDAMQCVICYGREIQHIHRGIYASNPIFCSRQNYLRFFFLAPTDDPAQITCKLRRWLNKQNRFTRKSLFVQIR